MISLFPSRLLRVRNLMLLTGLIVCAILVLGGLFTKHALSTLSVRIVHYNERLIQQNALASDLKTTLRNLAFLASPHQQPLATAQAEPTLPVLTVRLADIWSEYQQQIDADMRQRQTFRQLDEILSTLAKMQRIPAKAAAYEARIDAAFSLLETLDGELTRQQGRESKQAVDDLKQHEQQLNLLSIALAVVMAIVLWLVFHLLVAPLRRMGRIAQKIGRGEAAIESLSDCEVHLTELVELRELIKQMVKDLTDSNEMIANNASALIGLTQIASNISAQVRNGVIEETAISKDIFEDLREMRVGKTQMQQALAEALEIVATGQASNSIPSARIEELRSQLLLISDISNGWKALRDDLSRVLDGFDDMVRDRMTLASEMEKLTKEMSTAAKDMALRAAR